MATQMWCKSPNTYAASYVHLIPDTAQRVWLEDDLMMHFKGIAWMIKLLAGDIHVLV